MRRQVPVGNREVCKFAFLKPNSRPLSKEERKAFEAGNGLPDGMGDDVPEPKMSYETPSGSGTLEGIAVMHDGDGEYHGVIPVTNKGSYWFDGIALDGEGQPLSATGRIYFDGI